MKKNFWGGKDRGRQWNREEIKDFFWAAAAAKRCPASSARFSLQVLATLAWRRGFSWGLFTSIGAAG